MWERRIVSEWKVKRGSEDFLMTAKVLKGFEVTLIAAAAAISRWTQPGGEFPPPIRTYFSSTLGTQLFVFLKPDLAGGGPSTL